MKRVAIIGGIAVGKTSVGKFFRDLGAFVVNTDTIVHELLSSNETIKQQIVQQFGPNVLKNEKLDRRSLAHATFQDRKKLEWLEHLLHPRVLDKIEELYELAKNGAYRLFVVEIPLLFEIGQDSLYDTIILVTADEKKAKERFEKNGFSSTDYESRMNRQMDLQIKKMKADYILQNNGSLEELKTLVSKLNHILQNL